MAPCFSSLIVPAHCAGVIALVSDGTRETEGIPCVPSLFHTGDEGGTLLIEEDPSMGAAVAARPFVLPSSCCQAAPPRGLLKTIETR
jgi:hypothetical protein